jgi:hypothetical protein
MRQITTINDYPKQSFFITIENYESAEVLLEFKPLQQGWFINLTWGTVGIKQMRVVAGPNILSQFSNVLPFGIAISGVDDIDPFAIDAWLTGWKFYVLDQNDLAEVEALYVQ